MTLAGETPELESEVFLLSNTPNSLAFVRKSCLDFSDRQQRTTVNLSLVYRSEKATLPIQDTSYSNEQSGFDWGTRIQRPEYRFVI